MASDLREVLSAEVPNVEFDDLIIQHLQELQQNCDSNDEVGSHCASRSHVPCMIGTLVVFFVHVRTYLWRNSLDMIFVEIERMGVYTEIILSDQKISRDARRIASNACTHAYLLTCLPTYLPTC